MSASSETRVAVDRLYDAYFAGNHEGMLAAMADDVEVRFLGRGTYLGIDEARRFLGFNTGLLLDLDFRIRELVVDGEWAAAIWDETARTADGRPYANHGVDVFEVRGGRITTMHENNDIAVHRERFGYPPTASTPGPRPARPERDHGHPLVAALLRDCAGGRPEGLGACLADSVRWWDALAGWGDGVEGAAARLARLLPDPGGGALAVESAVVGDATAIVELSRFGPGQRPADGAPVTLVLRFPAGRIAEGRTYLDPDDLTGPDH